MNGCATVADFDPKSVKQTLNRWIANETQKASIEITEAIESYRFNEAAGAAYRFVWNIFCDWYLELSKPVLLGDDNGAKDETRAMVAFVRDEILKLPCTFHALHHRGMWHVTAAPGTNRASLLALARWPHHHAIAGSCFRRRD